MVSSGDIIYSIKIPNDAKVINVVESATPHGLFRSNKIIPTNPRPVTDEMALDFYNKSTIPEIAYYKSLSGVAVRGYDKTAKQILRDKVNLNNIDVVLEEWNDFTHKKTREQTNKTIDFIDAALNEIKNDLLINPIIDREPYIKELTNDLIINLTGESGSGKSYFSNKYINDDNYIVIDTDNIFSGNECNQFKLELRQIFINKYGEDLKSILIPNFDEIQDGLLLNRGLKNCDIKEYDLL